MASTERVTVRMSRGDPSTPWGFRLQGGQEYGSPLTIGKVLDGSLADRAGLQEGDKLFEVGRSHAGSLSHQGAQDAIVRSGNTLDLVVERFASRSWKPFVPPIDFPAETVTTTTTARPFGQPQQNYSSSRNVISEQYSSSKPSSTDQYLQQTGGLFGTDPKLTAPAPKEEPSYLRSQTLRMIKESESHTSGGGTRASPQPVSGGAPPPSAGAGGTPACDTCGRVIHGVFCKAGGKTMHGDCFKCATCGGSLKNVGYFLIGGKLYCDIHARQQQENQFKAAPPVDPNTFHSYPTPGMRKPVEPPKSFYQPAVLNKGPVSVQVPLPGSLSPRGGSDSYTSNYQYRKTTKTTSSTTNQQQQQQQQEPYSTTFSAPPPPPSWEQPHAPPPSQPLASPQPRSQQYSAPSPRSTSYNTQSDRTVPDAPAPSDSERPHPNPPLPVTLLEPSGLLDQPKPVESGQKRPTESGRKTPQSRRRQKWPPPPDPDRKMVPYWRIPVGLSSDFGPGASLTEDEDYKRVITYRHSSEKPPPKPKRNFLLEDAHKMEEWRLEQEKLAPERAAVAVMLQRASADRQIENENREEITEEFKLDKKPVPMKFFELWQGEEKKRQATPDVYTEFAELESALRSDPIEKTVTLESKSDDQHFTGFAENCQTIKRNEKFIQSSFGPRSYQPNHTDAFAIDTRTEYQHQHGNGANDPLAELTRDLLTLGEDLSKTRTTSEFRSVTTKESKWGGGGGGAPTYGPGRQPAAGARVPRRGKGILKQLHEHPRIPICESCNREIRGPFVLALNKTWCPDHFICATPNCHRKLLDIGFVEENGLTYCEFCYEKYLAPPCSKCSRAVVGDCLTALGRQWHPECFVCSNCHRPIGNSSFYMENGQPYCENDWNALFTTNCVSCQFAIDPGDRWVEALGNSYHSECFCCSVCQKNLEGQSFFAKAGRPYCKAHA